MFRPAVIPVITVAAMFGSVATAEQPEAPQADSVQPQPNRVVVMYFHRTERCPTCKMMGSYSVEAVKTGFVDQLKAGTVEFRMIDYEKKENQKLAKAYKVMGPALITAKIRDNKVAAYTDLKEIWSKVQEKPTFVRYVQDSIQTHMK